MRRIGKDYRLGDDGYLRFYLDVKGPGNTSLRTEVEVPLKYIVGLEADRIQQIVEVHARKRIDELLHWALPNGLDQVAAELKDSKPDKSEGNNCGQGARTASIDTMVVEVLICKEPETKITVRFPRQEVSRLSYSDMETVLTRHVDGAVLFYLAQRQKEESDD